MNTNTITKHSLVHQMHKDGYHEYDIYEVTHPEKGQGYALCASVGDQWALSLRGQVRALVIDTSEHVYVVGADGAVVSSVMDYGFAEELLLLLAYYHRARCNTGYALIKPVLDGELSVFVS